MVSPGHALGCGMRYTLQWGTLDRLALLRDCMDGAHALIVGLQPRGVSKQQQPHWGLSGSGARLTMPLFDAAS